MNRSSWFIILLAMAFTFMSSLWMVDMSVSALTIDGHLTNGFVLGDPMKIYHLGLGISILSFFTCSSIAGFLLGDYFSGGN